MKACQMSPSGWVSLAFRLVLGAVFVFAAGLKIYDPARFAVAVANFRLVPHDLINLVAIALPWIELVAGLFLILGVWVRASAWVVLGMAIVFLAIIVSALARGLNIECGCFGTLGARRIGTANLFIDTALLLMAAWLAGHERKAADVCGERRPSAG